MENKSVISLIAILVLVIGISGCTDNQNTNNQTPQQNTSINDTKNNTKIAISPSEAQKTAEKFIEEPNATAGTPILINNNGKSTYVVPVMLNGNQVGEILIDALTGENKGGAGGVSSDTK